MFLIFLVIKLLSRYFQKGCLSRKCIEVNFQSSEDVASFFITLIVKFFVRRVVSTALTLDTFFLITFVSAVWSSRVDIWFFLFLPLLGLPLMSIRLCFWAVLHFNGSVSVNYWCKSWNWFRISQTVGTSDEIFVCWLQEPKQCNGMSFFSM